MTVYTWSKTASLNDTADATINWREGQAPSTLNNSARAMMAALAKQRDDWSGVLQTTGTSTAYALTTNQVLSALTNGFSVTARINVASGASPTLDVDGLGAKDILSATSTAIQTGSLQAGGIYTFTYISADSAWYVHDVFHEDVIPSASDTVSGIVELATSAETITGTDTARAVTPKGYADAIANLDVVQAGVTNTLTVGYNVTEYDAGTKSSGTFTPDPANGNYQKAVNGGAHTLAPPASSCTMIIQYTNNGSAGTITTSGFTVVDGDTITTTNGDDFFFYITRVNSFTRLTVAALQ